MNKGRDIIRRPVEEWCGVQNPISTALFHTSHARPRPLNEECLLSWQVPAIHRYRPGPSRRDLGGERSWIILQNRNALGRKPIHPSQRSCGFPAGLRDLCEWPHGQCRGRHDRRDKGGSGVPPLQTGEQSRDGSATFWRRIPFPPFAAAHSL